MPVGLVFIGMGSLALAIGLHLFEPSFLAVMGPVAFYAFGIAFVMPAMPTAALARVSAYGRRGVIDERLFPDGRRPARRAWSRR